MSQDEIVFGEVTYREPEKRRRLDRDRRWACLAYEVPAHGELPIFLDRGTADAIERHALRDTSVELGGILLGKECVDDVTGEPFVCVTHSLEAKHYENTQASFTYTHDSWEEITRERDKQFPDLDIVGWYHTHPDFGIFLSSHDLFIQHHFFAQQLQVAYVVDPIRQTRGFFQWRNGQMTQVGGFFLTADRGDRVALARLVNDLENLPNPDGSGGGLSPRLEAELIAMLTRPSTPHYAVGAADRTQTAVLFALLGGMLGILGLSAVLWLNQINARVTDQAQVMQSLQKTIEDSSERQRIALDAAVNPVAGDKPERFLDQYARASRERDDALRQYKNQLTINDTLGSRTRVLSDDLALLRKSYDEAKKRAETYEAEAKVAGPLRERFANLKSAADAQVEKIKELEELLDTAEGRQAAALQRKYQNTWYAAVAGWVVSALLALGLLGGYAMLRPPADDGSILGDSGPARGNLPPSEEPPVRIT